MSDDEAMRGLLALRCLNDDLEAMVREMEGRPLEDELRHLDFDAD